MNRRILVEMATYKESEVFAQESVASASTKDVESLEDDKLREYVYNRIGNVGNTISEHDIGVLIKHHCGNRLRKKTALLTLPYVINANYIIHPWRRQTNNGEIIKGKDKRLSGMVGAPILIDGTKYLCNISLKKSANGKVRPYALTLKDGNGNIVENEKMDSTLQVPDSNSEPTTSGNAHFDKVTTSPDTNPSTNANIDKNNKTNKNESKNMSKNTIRLIESDLKRVISESVKKVLNEISIDTMQKAADKASERLHSDAYDSDEEKSRRTKQWMNIASTERYKSKSLDKEVYKLFYKYYNEYKDLSKAYEQFKTAMSKAYVTIDRNQGSYNY